MASLRDWDEYRLSVNQPDPIVPSIISQVPPVVPQVSPIIPVKQQPFKGITVPFHIPHSTTAINWQQFPILSPPVIASVTPGVPSIIPPGILLEVLTCNQLRFSTNLTSLGSGRLIPVNSGHSLAKWPILNFQAQPLLSFRIWWRTTIGIFRDISKQLTCCSGNTRSSHIHCRHHFCCNKSHFLSPKLNILHLGGTLGLSNIWIFWIFWNLLCSTWEVFLASQIFEYFWYFEIGCAPPGRRSWPLKYWNI